MVYVHVFFLPFSQAPVNSSCYGWLYWNKYLVQSSLGHNIQTRDMFAYIYTDGNISLNVTVLAINANNKQSDVESIPVRTDILGMYHLKIMTALKHLQKSR